MRGNEEKLPKITTLKKPSPQIVTRSPEKLYQGFGGDEGGRTLYSDLQPYIADNLLELLDKKWNPTGR